MRQKRKLIRRLLSFTLAIIMLASLIPVRATAEESDNNQNNNAQKQEPWVYEPSVSVQSVSPTVSGDESSADIVKVHVTATDASTGAEVTVPGAEVSLYVGAEFIRSVTDEDGDGYVEISLAGLSLVDRQNATISAKKVISRGKAIDGNARDLLFTLFPKDENGNYYRYTMELHSEKLDTAGNWLGEPIPTSYESNKIDIVFIIDATGSMYDEINNVKNNIAAFSENLIDSGLDIRFCVIDYRDITLSGEDTNVHETRGSHWITTIDDVVNSLGSIDVNGGGDTPETVLDPLGYVADNSLMKWRSDAYRFAFVLTDANYKTNNNYGYSSMRDLTDKLKEMNVVTSVITSSSYKSTYTYLYETTGGIYADIYSSTFDQEMQELSDSIIESVTREMKLHLSEPRMLVNLSVCYFADDAKSQSASYKETVQNMLDAYAHRLAETTDGHVLVDKVLLFSTDNRMDFYFATNGTPLRPSMADIQIQSELKDDGTWWFNVGIHNNAYPYGFFANEAVLVSKDYMDSFKHLKDADDYIGKATFVRILSGAIDINGYAMDDDIYKFSATQTHETGHYLLGFFDEYLDANAAKWTKKNKPYPEFGLMDNQYNDLEMSKTSIDYSYVQTGSLLTFQYSVFDASCEDTLAELLTTGTNNSYIAANNTQFYYYDLPNEGVFDKTGADAEYAAYRIHYTKASEDRRATYAYAGLDASDFLSVPDSTSVNAQLNSITVPAYVESAELTYEPLAGVEFVPAGNLINAMVSEEDDAEYLLGIKKTGDKGFTYVEVVNGIAELDISLDEVAEIRLIRTLSEKSQYNSYYISRSPSVNTGYFYMSPENSVMAYVTTDASETYTFIADNTSYENDAYFSVNQATRISSDNGVGFDSGEIYSVAHYNAEIDYTTLSWFCYADGVWTKLATDYSEEENMNIGARADLAGEGLYVLMAKKAPVGTAKAAENLEYTQSEDRDAVVTLTFDDPNSNSKFYNVYYSDKYFSSKNETGVVVRSFRADSNTLTLNLLERGRKVYAAVEIVLEDGSRSELSEIILIGGEADSDGDGIPDWYCDKYNLWPVDGEEKDIANSDDDGDGLTNLEEYLAGSDPTDPNDPTHTTNVPVSSIHVSTNAVSLGIGQEYRITATVLPENATNKTVNWSVANPYIAQITVEDGVCVITALAVGETEIYAVSADGGYSAVIKVTVTAEAVKFISVSTFLGGNIGLNFYVRLSEEILADPNAYMQFTFDGRVIRVPVSEGEPVVSGGNTNYRFTCEVTSKHMTDNVVAQIMNADGPVGNSKSMNVATYCNWMIKNSTDEELITLMKAMLNYGAAAQMLFNHNTENLANAALDSADKVLPEVDATAYAHLNSGSEPGIQVTSMTLILDSETSVRFYFQLTGNKSIEDYTFLVNGEEVAAKEKNGMYYVEVSNISAHRLDKMHEVKVCGITLRYAALSYVNQVMCYSNDPVLKDLARAMYAYFAAASSYAS